MWDLYCMNIESSSGVRVASGMESGNPEENRFHLPPIRCQLQIFLRLGWEFLNSSTIHTEVLAVLNLYKSYEFICTFMSSKYCFSAFFCYFWFIQLLLHFLLSSLSIGGSERDIKCSIYNWALQSFILYMLVSCVSPY